MWNYSMPLIETRKTGELYFRINNPRPIDGGCKCAYCVAHPEQVPTWDTLAVHPTSADTWAVHMPDPKGRHDKKR